MSFCNESPKRIGSYLLMASEKIQAHCPPFIAWCKDRRTRDELEYVTRIRNEMNASWWRRRTRASPVTLDDARQKIVEDVESVYGLRHTRHYPSRHLWDNQNAAERLLDMSRHEPRVFVSAGDFDLVFRAGFVLTGEQHAAGNEGTSGGDGQGQSQAGAEVPLS